MRASIRRAAVCMVAGLAVTLAVAAAASLRLLPKGRSSTRVVIDWDTEYVHGWMMTIDNRRPGMTLRSRSLMSPTSHGIAGGAPTLTLGHASSPNPPFPIFMEPSAGRDDLEPTVRDTIAMGTPGGPLLVWPFQVRVGWPARSLAYWHERAYGWGEYAVGTRGKSGIALGRQIGSGAMFHERIVPLQPLWGGLTLNTLAFAAVLFLPWQAAAWRRMQRRARRGLCAACGYELSGLNRCPECGAEPQT